MKIKIKKILVICLIIGVVYGFLFALNHFIPEPHLYQDGETFKGTFGMIRVKLNPTWEEVDWFKFYNIRK